MRGVKTSRSSTSPQLHGRLGLERGGGAGGDLHDVYFRIRQGILDGELKPGAIINQVHVARQLAVSRTPVREALRMLQAEGLIEAQFQHRMRVTRVTPQEVDAVYAMWILNQSLAMALTLPRHSAADLRRLSAAHGAMRACCPPKLGPQAGWEKQHRQFHQLLITHAGPVLEAAIESCWSRSERARRSHWHSTASAWRESAAEHQGLLKACRAGAVQEAIALMCRQLARVALGVIVDIDPDYSPQAITEALCLTMGSMGAGNKARKKNPGMCLMQELLAAVRASHHEGHVA
jgi:DNA-binding GntR family transcriptional regulator